MRKRILICDDEPHRQSKWRSALSTLAPVSAAFDIVSVSNRDLEAAVKNLEERRKAARSRKSQPRRLAGNIFDTATILIVDYDLLKLKSDVYLTGEGVAYLARCYSRCGLIVALNQFGANPFDLNLKGHPQSHADINLGGSQLDNLGLWTSRWPLFRPWSWPQLPAAADALERCVAQVAGHTTSSVIRFLGISEAVVARLPRSITEFLTPGAKPSSVTFDGFVTTSGNGFRPKDRYFSLESVARVAAAGVTKWLECLVLPGQDILVDAPHLVSRYPSLLSGDRKKIQSWNKTASLGPLTMLGLRSRAIEDHRFQRHDWISRPVWFWDALSNSETIEEVSSPWSSAAQDWVFCEDISRFTPRAAVREFVADLPSPFVRRFVVDSRSPYGRKFASSLRDVDYRPAVRLSL